MLARLSRIATGSSTTDAPLHEVEVDQVSLTELNELLDVLACMFPVHEVSVLRDLLLKSSHESRLHAAANILIESPHRYVNELTRTRPGHISDWEKFRSTKYKETVGKLLFNEYQGLSRFTVHEVLVENNYDYRRSRDTLANISSKSWRFNVAAWFSRGNKPSSSHPLPDVSKASTGCVPLDDEIHALGKPERDAQSAQDAQLAKTLNEAEYTEAHALLECECCFGDFTWEDLTTCTNGHLFCRGCLEQSVKEALYGQGSCLYPEKASVRCISSVVVPACDGFVAPIMLPRFLSPNVLVKLEQKFAHDQLQSTGLRLVRCPACSYAVVERSNPARLKLSSGIAFLLFVQCINLCLQYPLVILTVAVYLWFSLVAYWVPAGRYGPPATLRTVDTRVRDAMARVRRRKMSTRQRFKCENPRCGMASCIDCGRTWAAFHDCRREDSKRLYIERAMSEAVKRTCPQCHTSFVKTEGCNKLTCPCGYKMCYVCRADVRITGYWHFCRHFREVHGPTCGECEKCNLYETENEQAVATTAARRAAEEWAAGKRDGNAGTTMNAWFQRTPGYNDVWPPWAEQQIERVIELLFEW